MAAAAGSRLKSGKSSTAGAASYFLPMRRPSALCGWVAAVAVVVATGVVFGVTVCFGLTVFWGFFVGLTGVLTAVVFLPFCWRAGLEHAVDLSQQCHSMTKKMTI